MTREEASVLLKMMFAFWANTHERNNVEMETALNLALSALRPVSRERVELYTNRLWPGCPRCSMAKDEAFDAGGAHEFRALGDSLYYCDSNYGWEGEKIGYCPWCGKPLGKATELKHIEKLGVLLND